MGIFDKLKNNKVITSEERRKRNNEYIKEMGIACLETLPLIESSSDVKIKDIDDICKRAIACLLSIQLACDIEEGNDYNESRELFSKLLNEYNVVDNLLDKEQKIFNNNYSNQDVIDVVWTYEAYWSLIWALGLIDDIKIPNDICDCKKAVTLVGDCKDYKEFKNKCKLRNIEEILDMLDLYYRYHWACVEKRIRPETPIGVLNSDVVIERRRGLEWLISKVDDWNDISLDT